MGPSTADIQSRADAIADHLLGTCNPLPDEVLDTEGLAEALDELVLCCETCGWWVESHEIDDSGNCEDCAGET